ncbi:hypothetical protein V7157_14930 [Neobacillus drentensis]|uniref:hypothetical protein n=1 Tax=Neobacillus drentensis TaxID=220684 RepID=UPI003001C18D
MAEEKRKFVLYEYLLYFWKRKWFFVIIPLITTILIASAVYVMKNDKKYTGEALVFTGSVNAKELTNPNNIKADYKGLDDVFVPEKGQVKFTIHGNSEKQVSKDLKRITKDFNTKLVENATLRKKISQEYLLKLDKRVKVLEEDLASYNKKLDDDYIAVDPGSVTGTSYKEVSDLVIVESDLELTRAGERANSIRGDINLFEQPKVLSKPHVYPAKTYLPESIAIGIILGLVLTVALLMLLKYLGDARRYYKHD